MNKFIFTHKDHETLEFTDPKEAVKYFTNKGYGMWHFSIKFNDETISLDEFNDINDNWPK